MTWILISAKQELIESPYLIELIVNNSGTAVAMQINLDDAEDYDITVKQIRNILKEDQFYKLFSRTSYDRIGHNFFY